MVCSSSEDVGKALKKILERLNKNNTQEIIPQKMVVIIVNIGTE